MATFDTFEQVSKKLKSELKYRTITTNEAIILSYMHYILEMLAERNGEQPEKK